MRLPKIASIIAFCLAAGPASADREIVYSARYYTPPGTRRQSYWHLYRISPNGTGRVQLTSARANDYAPQWSPDGRRILFIRADPGGASEYFWSDHQWLCTIQANGRGMKKLAELDSESPTNCRWSPDGRTIAVLPTDWEDKPDVLLVDARTGRTQTLTGANSIAWSTDGRLRYVAKAKGGDYFETLPRGERTPVATHLQFPCFINASTIAGIAGTLAGKDIQIVLIGTDGKEKVRKRPTFVTYEDNAINGEADGLTAIPKDRRHLIYAANRHNSTTGIMEQFYLVDPSSGGGSEICYGQFISLSPAGNRFVTAPGRDLGPYGRRGGQERSVWVAPLQVGRIGAGKPRDIVSGAVWVVGADWRKGPAH